MQDVITDEPDTASKIRPKLSDDWLAIGCAWLFLIVSFVAVLSCSKVSNPDLASAEFVAVNPLADFIGKPSKWTNSPVTAFVKKAEAGTLDWGATTGVLGAVFVLATLLTTAIRYREGQESGFRFMLGFAGVFALATLSYTLAAQSVVKAYNLEYALWALMVGLILCNTIGTPKWVQPGV